MVLERERQESGAKILKLPTLVKGVISPVESPVKKDKVLEQEFCVKIKDERGYCIGKVFSPANVRNNDEEDLPLHVESIIDSVSRKEPYCPDYIVLNLPLNNLHIDSTGQETLNKLLEVGLARQIASKVVDNLPYIDQREVRLFRGLLGNIPFAAIAGDKKEIKDGIAVRKVILGINL